MDLANSEKSDPPGKTRSMVPRTILGIGLLGALMVGGLMASGRVWWCEAGDLVPWSWDVWSRHNSQHWLDPYSISHFQHGLGLFLLLRFVGRRWFHGEATVLLVALVEAIWELVENTPAMIHRYRTVTISLDYFGDSICNSIGDYVACLTGVSLARRIPWYLTTAVFVLLELVSLVWIRDSLMINILMLVYPLDVVRTWQAGGG